MSKVTAKSILKSIDCPYLTLFYVKGGMYWVFAYDNLEKNIFETQSVYTPRLNDMSLETWVSDGRSFVDSVENGEL